MTLFDVDLLLSGILICTLMLCERRKCAPAKKNLKPEKTKPLLSNDVWRHLNKGFQIQGKHTMLDQLTQVSLHPQPPVFIVFSLNKRRGECRDIQKYPQP